MKWTRYMDETLLAQFHNGLRDELIAEHLLIPVRLVTRRRKGLGLRPKACKQVPWIDALKLKDKRDNRILKLRELIS